jgi:hypothetical protein
MASSSWLVGGGALAVEQRSKPLSPYAWGACGAFAVSALTLSACSGPAVWGNLAVFAVSVGIFVSTLALGHGR